MGKMRLCEAEEEEFEDALVSSSGLVGDGW